MNYNNQIVAAEKTTTESIQTSLRRGETGETLDLAEKYISPMKQKTKWCKTPDLNPTIGPNYCFRDMNLVL